MTIDVADLSALRAEVTGPVLLPGDDGYEKETAAWNEAVPQYPAVVVGATSVADVRAAVRFADARDLPVAVVATGHGALIRSDGALLINLSRMDGIVVDSEARTATVGGAVAVNALVERAAPYTAIGSIHAEPSEPVPGYAVATLLSDFPAEAADRLIDAAGPGSDTSVSLIEIRQLGGAMAEPPALPDAVGNRTAAFQYFAGTAGEPGMAEAFHPSLEELMRALSPWDTGRRSVNFMEVFDTAPETVATGYDPDAYERLSLIKHRYDPKNLFRINHNIR
jgi:FAD/FMN-containing dehydrogenase